MPASLVKYDSKTRIKLRWGKIESIKRLSMNENLVWIRFDESDRYSPAPNFCIPAMTGGEVCREGYRGVCNLVLVFGNYSSDGDNIKLVESFIDHSGDYQESNTCVLLISEGPLPGIEPKLIELDRYKFIQLLIDKKNAVMNTYASLLDESLVREKGFLVFILDMYGAPYYALNTRGLDYQAFHSETKKWLEFIGMQCPE
jgi:peroxiredoxin